MSVGFSRLAGCLALGFALCVSMEPRGHAQGTQRPHRDIELSETNSAEILTNLNQLSSKKEGVSQLEDQLRTLNQFTPKNLQPRFSVPYVSPRVVPSKTMQELLDRQKFWGMTPEELGVGAGGSDKSDPFSAFSRDSFEAKKSSSSLQQFYDALNRSENAGQNTPRSSDKNLLGPKSKDFESSPDSDFVDDSDLPAGVRDKAKRLQDFLNKNPGSMFNTVKPRPTFDKFLGFTEPNPAADAVRGPKSSMETFMDQFKKVLDSQTAGVRVDPTVSALVAPSAGAAQPATPYPSLDSLPSSPHHEVTQTTPGTINSVPNPSTMQDLNAATLNAWNPMYSPPKLELPKVTPPSPPNLQFPRRKF